jgi:hypothetical protein
MKCLFCILVDDTVIHVYFMNNALFMWRLWTQLLHKYAFATNASCLLPRTVNGEDALLRMHVTVLFGFKNVCEILLISLFIKCLSVSMSALLLLLYGLPQIYFV